MTKAHAAKPTDRLWGAVALWGRLFMACAALNVAALGYRIWLLARIPGDTPMGEYDFLSDHVSGAEAEVWTTPIVAGLYILTYLVSVVLVLKWYLRSVRNAHRLVDGVRTSPRWTIWWFILPVVSLWKPYGMTSELWRSSHAPDRWKRLRDTPLLRPWWGAVLVAGSFSTASSLMSRSITTASHLLMSDATLAVACLFQIVAGVLFLRIGAPVSRLQSQMIAEGRVRPAGNASPPTA